MNTPTPRTDAAWSATFDGQQMSAGKTARTLRDLAGQLERELSLALAACRAILFAAKQAQRYRGEYSLPDLITAERLARAALDATEGAK